MKNGSFFTLILCVLAAGSLHAQNIGIGTTHPRQKLHVAGGLRIDTLSNGKDSGLLKHNPDGTVYSLQFTGDSTQVLRGNGTFGAASLMNAASLTNAWLLGGNAGTSPDSNFLGTTDNQPLRLRINNQWAGGMDSVNRSTFFGYGAGKMAASAGNNAAFGYQALNNNSSGSDNTAFGQRALVSNNGYFNSAFGSTALFNNTSGFNNLAMGSEALYWNTTGSNNIALGVPALYRNAVGKNNIAIGLQALNWNFSGSSNVAIGINTLFNSQSSSHQVAIGDSALLSENGSSGNNTAVGTFALMANTTGNDNTAIGADALLRNSTGSFNTAVGSLALGGSTLGDATGGDNTAIGVFSLVSNATGGGNVAIGESALQSNRTGNNLTAVGFQAGVSIDNLSNATALGAGANPTTSNTVQLGNSAVTTVTTFGSYQTISDGRFKFNVKEDIKGLDFILKLRPVSYQLDARKANEYLNIASAKGNTAKLINSPQMQVSYNEAMALRRTGFIAQEVEKAAQESGYDFTGVMRPKNPQDHYSLSYQSFIMPMVKAIQEQQQQIDDLKKLIAGQQKTINDLIRNK